MTGKQGSARSFKLCRWSRPGCFACCMAEEALKDARALLLQHVLLLLALTTRTTWWRPRAGTC